ncbi:MAG: EamA family transporter [Vicinamibacterales bacterium]
MLAPIAWVVLAVIWGSTWIVSRLGLESLPPLSFAGIRFVLASSMLFAVLAARGRHRPAFTRGDWLFLVRTGLIAFAVTYALMFWGMRHVSAGMAAVVFSTVPLFTMVFAHRDVAGEPLSGLKVVGALIGLSGVAVIFGQELERGHAMVALGCLAILGSALSMARAQVSVKVGGRHLHPITMAAWQLLIGGSTLVVVGFVVEGPPWRFAWSPTTVACLLYLSFVASSLAWYLYYWLLRSVRVTTMSAVTLVQPVIAIALGWALLGESLSPQVLAGAAATLVGVSLIMRPGSGAARRLATAAADR